MTRRHITPREIRQADARYRQRCLPARPRDQPGRGPGLSRARPPAPGRGTLRQLAWTAAHGQYCPLHWRAAAAAHRRRPRRDETPQRAWPDPAAVLAGNPPAARTGHPLPARPASSALIVRARAFRAWLEPVTPPLRNARRDIGFPAAASLRAITRA